MWHSFYPIDARARAKVSWIRPIVLVIPHTAHNSLLWLTGVETLVFKSFCGHTEFINQLIKANPHHRRSNKVELFIYSKYPWKSLQWQKMIKVWMLDFVCHGRRIPSFNLNFSYSCDVRRGEGGFQVVKRFLVRYENAKQSKSKLGLLLRCWQLPIAADLLNSLKAF